MNADDQEKLPTIVSLLGYGGLIPFISLALATLLDNGHASIWREALFAYGAVILSFVGALHWAFAMMSPTLSSRQRNGVYIWSVMPALIGWLAILLPLKPASSLLVLGFIAQYWQDMRLAKNVVLPDWFLPLRFRLTLVAVVCLVAGSISNLW
jgi:Protein of unknown function (DUF3429)